MPPWNTKRFPRRQRNPNLPMCRHGIHNFGHMDEIGMDGRYLIGKICSSCTYVIYKDEWVEMQERKRTRGRPRTTPVKEYIHIFSEEE